MLPWKAAAEKLIAMVIAALIGAGLLLGAQRAWDYIKHSRDAEISTLERRLGEVRDACMAYATRLHEQDKAWDCFAKY